MEKIFDNNRITKWDNFTTGKEILFAQNTYYTYRAINLQNNQSCTIPSSLETTIYFFACSGHSNLEFQNSGSVKTKIGIGDVLNLYNYSGELFNKGENATILFASSNLTSPQMPVKNDGFILTPAVNIKKVVKPWGFELWLNGEQGQYAFKHIEINSGTRTSLQYHQFKNETNVLINGSAKLHYKSNPNVANDGVMDADISQTDLASVSSIDVPNNTIHRIEALTNILLCEVSTAHLDDVIRISDDSGRGHGRIKEEHHIHE